jgi:serine/threonine-protein kinase RsbW
MKTEGTHRGLAGADRGAGPRAVRLLIPAKPEYISLCRLALTGLSRLQALSDEDLGDLKLAVTEACTNSVRHAYDDGEGLVEIVYELRAGSVVIEVSDTGRGFAHTSTAVVRRDNSGDGGLGLAIIDSLADELEISDRPGGGARLRFVKVLTD